MSPSTRSHRHADVNHVSAQPATHAPPPAEAGARDSRNRLLALALAALAVMAVMSLELP